MKMVFYTGTVVLFKVITSKWGEEQEFGRTQGILLDLLGDLVIRSRGVFSDFSNLPHIVDMLLDLVGKMVEGHGGEFPYINDVIQKLEDDNLWNGMDNSLRDRALTAIRPSSDTHNGGSSSSVKYRAHGYCSASRCRGGYVFGPRSRRRTMIYGGAYPGSVLHYSGIAVRRPG
jgi:hypothetical protein